MFVLFHRPNIFGWTSPSCTAVWITQIICPSPPPWSCPGGWTSAGTGAFAGATGTVEGGPITIGAGALFGAIFGCFTSQNPDENPFPPLDSVG